ncbi:MAG: 4-vinyl reductase [Clostridiales Family XIII bacterium]|jgi:predicted hydrocarbon binding protein|nr:4-vinyl reductase [Clostridiales Family XIII bacterium]
MKQTHSFDWQRLGNLTKGRGNIGSEMPVSVYRLMQYTLMDELNDTYGAAQAHDVFRRAGSRAGRAFAENLLDRSLPFNEFLAQFQKTLREMKIGILRMEKSDLASLEFVLTIEEDLECSGLPVSGQTVCWYDEGFLAGVLGVYTQKDFVAVEVDCWATGGTVCRFNAYLEQAQQGASAS